MTLSVPIITLTFLTLIFLSFEIKCCWWVLSELIFIISGVKLADSLIFFPWFFPLQDCLLLFGCQSGQALFKQFTLKFIFWWKNNSNVLKRFWTIETYLYLGDEYHLSINNSYEYSRYIRKQNGNSYINFLKKHLPIL